MTDNALPLVRLGTKKRAGIAWSGAMTASPKKVPGVKFPRCHMSLTIQDYSTQIHSQGYPLSCSKLSDDTW